MNQGKILQFPEKIETKDAWRTMTHAHNYVCKQPYSAAQFEAVQILFDIACKLYEETECNQQQTN